MFKKNKKVDNNTIKSNEISSSEDKIVIMDENEKRETSHIHSSASILGFIRHGCMAEKQAVRLGYSEIKEFPYTGDMRG